MMVRCNNHAGSATRCCGLARTHARRCYNKILRPQADERHCVLVGMVAGHNDLPRTARRYCVLAWMVTRYSGLMWMGDEVLWPHADNDVALRPHVYDGKVSWGAATSHGRL